MLDIAAIYITDVTADPVDGAVVVEGPAAPVTAFITRTVIAVPVIDAAIKADVGSPVSGIPKIPVVHKAPITGRPECINVGGEHPGSRHPVITGRRPIPIPRRPDIVGAGDFRLFVVGDRRRCVRSVHGWLLRSVIVALVVALIVATLILGDLVVRDWSRLRGVGLILHLGLRCILISVAARNPQKQCHGKHGTEARFLKWAHTIYISED